jgi:hypothetical protein
VIFLDATSTNYRVLPAHAVFTEDPALHRFPDQVVPSPRWKAWVPMEVDKYSWLRHVVMPCRCAAWTRISIVITAADM